MKTRGFRPNEHDVCREVMRRENALASEVTPIVAEHDQPNTFTVAAAYAVLVFVAIFLIAHVAIALLHP